MLYSAPPFPRPAQFPHTFIMAAYCLYPIEYYSKGTKAYSTEYGRPWTVIRCASMLCRRQRASQAHAQHVLNNIVSHHSSPLGFPSSFQRFQHINDMHVIDIPLLLSSVLHSQWALRCPELQSNLVFRERCVVTKCAMARSLCLLLFVAFELRLLTFTTLSCCCTGRPSHSHPRITRKSVSSHF